MQSKEFDIHEFKKKYGSKELGILVGEFIKQAPEFQGDRELARKIGRVIGDLEFVLDHLDDCDDDYDKTIKAWIKDHNDLLTSHDLFVVLDTEKNTFFTGSTRKEIDDRCKLLSPEDCRNLIQFSTSKYK